MPRRSHPHAALPSPHLGAGASADCLPLDEESGVRALPRASLPPPHPVALFEAGVPTTLRPLTKSQPRTAGVPALRLELGNQTNLTEASQRLLLERAQRKARIKQAAAEASVRLAALFREQEEHEREEMVWRAKLREAKQRLQEEAEWKAAMAAAKLELAIAQQRERAQREEAEWEAALIAAKRRQQLMQAGHA